MRFVTKNALLNILLAALIGQKVQAATTQRYILMHPDTTDPLQGLGSTSIAALTPLLQTGNHSWSTVNLTSDEVLNVSQTLQGQGLIVPDTPIEIPYEDTGTARRLRATTAADTSPYLTNYPQCAAYINGITIYVPDTVLYANAKNFQGFDVKNEKSYVDVNADDPIPCHPHGSEVTSVFLGSFATDSDLEVRGIGIFGCDGRGYVSSMIAAFQDALNSDAANKLAASKGAPLRRTVINLSGVGPSNDALDSAVTAVYKEGLPIFVAAGNNNENACNSQSPAETIGVLAIGATTGAGDELALFSNFGLPCVRLYLPGDPVTVINPITGKQVPASGTSFGAPQATALGAIELSLNLQATPDEVYANILNRTTVVTLPAGSVISSMNVLTKAAACPLQQQFLGSYTTTKIDNNKFRLWRNLPAAPATLCFTVDIEAITKNGYALLGLRTATQRTTTITLGRFESAHHYRHAIHEPNHATHNTTKNRIPNRNAATTVKIAQQDGHLIVSAYDNSTAQTLLSAADTNQYSAMALSSGGKGRIHYTNGLQC